MSYVTFNSAAAPATPAATKSSAWFDSADHGLKAKDSDGLVTRLTPALPNLIRNGGFWFAQRQVPATATTYSSVGGRLITADGWSESNENASITYDRIDATTPETNLAARYYGQFIKITSTGKFWFGQVIEANDIAPVRGHYVRLRVLMKQQGVASTARLGILQLTSAGTADTVPNGAGLFITAWGGNTTDPTFGANLALIPPTVATQNTTIRGNALDCSLGANWLVYSGIFLIPTDAKNLIPCVFTDSQLLATQGINISEAVMHNSPGPLDWAPESIGVEQRRVQRYYCKTFNIDTGPVTAAGALTGEIRIPSPVGASTAFAPAWTWEYPVPMRAAPTTITLYNPAAANAQIRNMTLNTDCTLSAAAANGEKRLVLSGTTPAATVAGTNILGVHVTADAEL